MLNKNNKIISAFLACSLLFALLSTAILPISVSAEESVIAIENKEDFIEFASKCSFDKWSVGKTVQLKCDLSFEGEVILPVPSFSGHFDGEGHTISDFKILGAYSPAGLFSTLEASGSIENLNVSGVITPDGDAESVGGIVGLNRGSIKECSFIGTVIGSTYVGGIVGTNQLSGSISTSASSGEIIGENGCGGIAGRNLGIILSSVNRAKVNTVSITPELTLDQLNISLTLDITKLPSLKSPTVSDLGGIVGYSSGMLLGCTNMGRVGYPHVGYNVGGIAGRSSGHVSGCQNRAEVFGRKDVGGIVGQMEPYVSFDLSEDMLKSLEAQLGDLSSAAGELISDAEGTLPALSDSIAVILSGILDATAALEELTDGATDYVDGIGGEINRFGEILSDTLARLETIFGVLPELTDSVSDALTEIESALSGLRELASLGSEAMGDVSLAGEDIAECFEIIGKSVATVESGINELRAAVSVNDEEAAKTALDRINEGLDGVVEGFDGLTASIEIILKTLGEAEKIFAEDANIAEEAKIWLTKLGESLTDSLSALRDLSGAIVTIRNGVNSLGESISFDGEAAGEGLSLIIEGFGDLSDGAFALRSAFSHIKDAASKLQPMMDKTGEIFGDLSECAGHFADAADTLTALAEECEALLGYLAGVDPIQIPGLGDNTKDAALRLFAAITSIEKELSVINGDMTSMSVELLTKLANVKSILDGITDDTLEMIGGLTDDDMIDGSVSLDEVEKITNGKVFDCTNYGNVEGDKNVGGISGAMGLEYTLDPEDDSSPELSVTQKRTYKLKAVIHRSKNLGDVAAKYDGAGGVVGKMDLGLILGCEAFSRVESQSGNYVGGIAGISAGSILESYVKSTLSGGKYVGGIVGSGVGESLLGGASTVSDCISMVEILRAKQYFGAISGADVGEFKNNLFISDSLAGIDRVSYGGRAEPISHGDLTARRSLPEEFFGFTLEFVAEGVVLYSTTFEYGASFDKEIFPEIPEKAGHYGSWDKNHLENLRFDTTVSVIYTPYVTTLGGSEKRGEREIFLLIGDFTESDRLTAQRRESANGFTPNSGFFFKDKLLECWSLTLPENAGNGSRIHLLPPEEGCRVFAKLGGKWTEISTSEFGSYLTFDIEGEEIEIAIVSHRINPLPLIIIGVILLSGIAALTVIYVKKKKQKIAPIEAPEEENK
ncbi:MAG: methyl-accepting chemotaxis protein [Clostridia bacterium]|nr:methyl-accepting chemotaxis protein [Clostridia bacterium]